jgi:hypothetical protein
MCWPASRAHCRRTFINALSMPSRSSCSPPSSAILSPFSRTRVIARNLETRIVKLEVSRRRPNELLLVWCRPDGDVRAAAKRSLLRTIASFRLGWFDDGPPAPRWHGKRSEPRSSREDAGGRYVPPVHIHMIELIETRLITPYRLGTSG